jgi:DME family drug/metabolite transporter
VSGTRAAALAVVAAAALWGTVGAAQELGAPTAAPAGVAAVRSLAGGLLLLGAVVALGRGPGVVAVLRRGLVPTLGAGAAITVFQVGYLGGIRATGVAVGTLVAIGSAPAFAGALVWAAGRRPTRRWALGTAVTVAGAAALVLPGGGDGTVEPAGVGLGLLAGLAYATYTYLSKRALERGLGGPETMAVVFVVAGLLLLPVLVVVDLGWLATGGGAATAVWLAVAATALAYVLFARGLAGVDAATATTLTLAEPLTAAVLALTVMQERFGPWSLAGLALLVVGLVLAAGAARTAVPGPTAPAASDR